MKRLLKLYPAVWRGRYEAEVADLLDELPTDRRIAIDLFRGAVIERGRAFWRRLPEAPVAAGGPPIYFGPVHRHPTAVAVIALLLVAPTSTFVLLSFAAYELGVPGLQAIVEPALQTLTLSPWVDLFLLTAPFLAFIVALAPLIGIGLSRADGELRVTFGFQARTLNLVVIALCIVVGGFLAGHIILETLLEAP